MTSIKENNNSPQSGSLIPNSVLFNRKGNFKKGVKCPLSGKNAPVIDHKNLELLQRYVTEKSRIVPRRITGVCSKKQRQLKKAINIARNLALLPFTVI